MLKLLLDNNEIEIDSDISINVLLQSPIFTKSGSLSFDFYIKNTDHNKRVFNFPSRIERNGKRTKKYSNFKIQFHNFILTGSANVSEPDNIGLKINCQFSEGDFYNLISGVSLPNINYGGNISIGTTSDDVLSHANTVVTQRYPEAKWQFPKVWNKEFYDEYPLNDEGFINNWSEEYQQFVANIISDPDLYYRRTTLVPYPYLLIVLQKVIEHFNFIPGGLIFNDENIRHIIMHNNYAIDKVENKKYYARVSRNSSQSVIGVGVVSFNNKTTYPNEDLDNRYSTGFHYYTCPLAGFYDISVSVTVTTIYDQPITIEIIAVDTFINPAVNINTTTGTIAFQTSIKCDINTQISIRISTTGGNPQILINHAELSIVAASYSRLNILQKFINIANHVPEIKASEFIDAIQNTFGCIALVNYITREVNFKFLKDILKADKIEDITSFADENFQFYNTDLIGKLSFDMPEVDISQYEIFEIAPYNSGKSEPTKAGVITIALDIKFIWLSKVNEETNILEWVYLGRYSPAYIIGDGKEIKAAIKILGQTYYHIYTLDDVQQFREIFIPVIDEKGISPAYKVSGTKSPLTLTYYLEVTTYPLAHPSYILNNGSAERTLDLAWEGESGLIELFWKDWIYWYNNLREGVKRHINWDAIALNKVEWDKKYRIKNINYFVESIELTFKLNEIICGDTKLLKC